MVDHSDHMSQTEAGRLDLVHRIGASVVAVVIIVFGIIAAIAANRGEEYYYPVAIKFLN